MLNCPCLTRILTNLFYCLEIIQQPNVFLYPANYDPIWPWYAVMRLLVRLLPISSMFAPNVFTRFFLLPCKSWWYSKGPICPHLGVSWKGGPFFGFAFPFFSPLFTFHAILTLQSANKGILFHCTFICTRTPMIPHEVMLQSLLIFTTSSFSIKGVNTLVCKLIFTSISLNKIQVRKLLMSNKIMRNLNMSILRTTFERNPSFFLHGSQSKKAIPSYSTKMSWRHRIAVHRKQLYGQFVKITNNNCK